MALQMFLLLVFAPSVIFCGITKRNPCVCGGTFTSPEGQIASPGFPGKYPHNKNCGYVIEMEVGHIVALTFQSLDVEEISGCSLDSVEIYDGTDNNAILLGKLCGGITPNTTYKSSSNAMFVRFKSDSSENGDGFQATYTSPAGGCGASYNGSSGQIKSPEYPNNYRDNLDCGHHIQVDEGHLVELSFDDFNVESPCRYDRLEIYDGVDTTATKITDLCGSQTPEPVRSTGRDMYILLHTDGGVVRKGYSANYRAVVIVPATEGPDACETNNSTSAAGTSVAA